MEQYNQYLAAIEQHMGDKTTSEGQLLKVGRLLFGDEFNGVFPADEVDVKRYGIANLDTSDEPGSHWVAIVHIDGFYLFYDSFGRTPWDDDAEQAIEQSNCGQRCLAWLVVVHNCGLEKALTI